MVTPTIDEEHEDAFGNLLIRRTRNDADLAAHYRFTPERYRFFKNGTRVLLKYEDIDSNPDFDDKRAGEEDVFILQPSAGDTLKFKSAERFRYTVNFVSEVTQAFALNQSLTNTNDRLTMGLDTSPDQDLSDGYFLEHLPGHADTEADIFAKRNGNVIGDRTTVDLSVPVTFFQRLENDYNWYNVGESNWRNSFAQITTEVRRQINRALDTLAFGTEDANTGPGGRGPISGNGHIVFEVEADSGTSGLELYAGSISFTTLGSAVASVKRKGAEETGLAVTQTADWEPLFAMRIAPDRPNVAVQLTEIDITTGTGKVLVIGCDPSKVLKSGGVQLEDGDFSIPEEHANPNSALEVTDGSTVTQFPGADGVTGATHPNPGGYQLAFDTTRSAGPGSTGTTRSGTLEERHGILDGDIAVVVARPATTDDMGVFYITEFDE